MAGGKPYRRRMLNWSITSSLQGEDFIQGEAARTAGFLAQDTLWLWMVAARKLSHIDDAEQRYAAKAPASLLGYRGEFQWLRSPGRKPHAVTMAGSFPSVEGLLFPAMLTCCQAATEMCLRLLELAAEACGDDDLALFSAEHSAATPPAATDIPGNMQPLTVA